MLRRKKGDIIGEVGRRVGDEGQLAPKAFDGSDLDRSARTGDQIIGGVQAQIERRRSEEHTSELQSLMRISYAVFCLKKKTTHSKHTTKPKKQQVIHNYQN